MNHVDFDRQEADPSVGEPESWRVLVSMETDGARYGGDLRDLIEELEDLLDRLDSEADGPDERNRVCRYDAPEGVA